MLIACLTFECLPKKQLQLINLFRFHTKSLHYVGRIKFLIEPLFFLDYLQHFLELFMKLLGFIKLSKGLLLWIVIHENFFVLLLDFILIQVFHKEFGDFGSILGIPLLKFLHIQEPTVK